MNILDPFTLDSLEITLPQIKYKGSDLPVSPEQKDLYREYLLEPQKQKKSNSYAEFSECKKRFDLTANREDPQQNDLISSRFEIYNSNISIPPATNEMISFLSSVHGGSTAIQRREVFLKALQLKQRPQPDWSSDVSLKQITSKILEIDPPPAATLSTQEKLTMLRALPKHLGDWEKISKEYKDKPVPVDLLKKIWRCLKVTMKEEVMEIKKKNPQYHYLKWIRAAVRKLEQNSAKKSKLKLSVSINPKPKEQRFDMLTIMAEAENAKCIGIESTTSLNITSSSSFKAYGNGGTLQELFN